MDSIINMQLIANPKNWFVIGSMALIGAVGYNIIVSRMLTKSEGN